MGSNVRSEGEKVELAGDLDLGDIGHPDNTHSDTGDEEIIQEDHQHSSDTSNETTDDESTSAETTDNSTTSGETSNEEDDSRRAVRNRAPPKRMTYDKIGTPSIRR